MPLSREDGWWEVEGAELTIKEPLSLSQLELLEVAGLEDDPGLEMNVTSATKELLQSLRNGRVKAQGLAEEGEWSDILADRWTGGQVDRFEDSR